MKLTYFFFRRYIFATVWCIIFFLLLLLYILLPVFLYAAVSVVVVIQLLAQLFSGMPWLFFPFGIESLTNLISLLFSDRIIWLFHSFFLQNLIKSSFAHCLRISLFRILSVLVHPVIVLRVFICYCFVLLVLGFRLHMPEQVSLLPCS